MWTGDGNSVYCPGQISKYAVKCQGKRLKRTGLKARYQDKYCSVCTICTPSRVTMKSSLDDIVTPALLLSVVSSVAGCGEGSLPFEL